MISSCCYATFSTGKSSSIAHHVHCPCLVSPRFPQHRHRCRPHPGHCLQIRERSLKSPHPKQVGCRNASRLEGAVRMHVGSTASCHSRVQPTSSCSMPGKATPVADGMRMDCPALKWVCHCDQRAPLCDALMPWSLLDLYLSDTVARRVVRCHRFVLRSHHQPGPLGSPPGSRPGAAASRSSSTSDS